jgi:hypothetical protein
LSGHLPIPRKLVSTGSTRIPADTCEEVASEDITKGYKVDTDTYIEALPSLIRTNSKTDTSPR